MVHIVVDQIRESGLFDDEEFKFGGAPRAFLKYFQEYIVDLRMTGSYVVADSKDHYQAMVIGWLETKAEIVVRGF